MGEGVMTRPLQRRQAPAPPPPPRTQLTPEEERKAFPVGGPPGRSSRAAYTKAEQAFIERCVIAARDRSDAPFREKVPPAHDPPHMTFPQGKQIVCKLCIILAKYARVLIVEDD